MALVENESAGGSRQLRRAGLVVIIAYAVLTGPFVAGVTFAEPDGWHTGALTASGSSASWWSSYPSPCPQ